MSAAIDAYRAYLGPEVITFPIDGLDRLGVPVWCALGVRDGHYGQGVGYGASAHDAERGALGEAVEDLAGKRYADRVEPVELTIAEALARGAVDPRTLSLRLGDEPADDRPVWWVPAGDRLVPLEAVVNTAKEHGRGEPLFPPITNGAGAGAGDDLERAVGHGLNELLQRDLNWSSFKALDTGRAVDARTVDAALVDRLARLGVDVRLKYSGHAYGVHAFHASARDADPDLPPVMRTATGEGADPDPLVAGRKALLELCSSRARKRFFFGGAEAMAIAPPEYLARFAEPAGGAPLSELGVDLHARFDALLGDPEAVARVVDRITAVHETVPLPPPSARQDDALAPLVVRITEPNDPATVAKVIVPGLEAEVLSHHRLGPRGLARLRERCPWAVSDAPVEGWTRGLGAWVDEGWLDSVAEGFMPLYREPDRHAYEAPAA